MKKAISVFLSLLMLLSVCGFAAFAEGETTKEVTYIDASGTPQTVEAIVAVPGSHYSTSDEANWYVIEGTYNGDGQLFFEDAVTNLILADDADWTITNSDMINIGNVRPGGGTLNVYVQANNTGKLNLTAGMLSYEGAMNIYGGSISSYFKIGGSPSRGDLTASNSTLTGTLCGKNITLCNCTVNGKIQEVEGDFTLDGGSYTSVCGSYEMPVRARSIVINNATVEGSGGQIGLSATGGSVTICNSTVTVTASNIAISGNAVSISGDNTSVITNGSFGLYSSGGPIEITGGTVKAECSTFGIYSNQSVTITGGNVTVAGNVAGVNAGSTLALGADTPNSSYTLGSVFSGATVTVKANQTLTDGDNDYTGTLSSEQVAALAGKTLTCKHNVIVKGAGDATCGQAGYTGDEYCSVCGAKLSEGEIIPPTGSHTTVVVNAKDATATEDGYTGDEVCTVCGQTSKTGEVIPAAGGDTPDEPGDGGDCPYCGKYHAKLWVRIVHLVLWLFQNLFRVFK